MAQRSGLFDSTEIVETIDGYPKGNRAETADFFAKYFSNFISNGIFAKPTTNFQVTSAGGMTVNIRPGSCFINGYMAWDSDSENHDIPTDNTQHDYYLVQRLYLPDGAITKTWLTDPDTSAIPVRTATTHDLIIAMVRVPANAREITDSMITDYRFDTDKCGIVHGVIDQLDTSDIALQLNTAVQEYITAAENSLVTWQGSFDQWFEAVKNQLSGDAATALEANKMARAYTVEDSAEDVVNRTAILAGYYLAEGQTVYVRFVNAVPAGATLNVNNTGNVPIYNGDEPISKVDIPADAVAAMLYTGDKYILLNPAVSASGVTYITASGSSAVIANTESGAPAVINTGDRFSVLCSDEVSANATLNINGTGAHPILNNYTGTPIVSGDIPAGYTADIVFDGTNYILLNALKKDIDTVYEMVLLWQNASPSSKFAAQTISVDLSQYDIVAIEYRAVTDVSVLSMVYCMVGKAYFVNGYYGRYSSGNHCYLCYRKYTVDRTGIAVADYGANYPIYFDIGNKEVESSTSWNYSSFCIPTAIYGIKGVKIS